MAGRGEPGPTALRIILGAHLRRLRERAGTSRSAAGYAIRGSASKISRLELGRVGFKERDVLDLLTLYGVADPAERERLLHLAREANHRGWWQQYGEVTPDWFGAYLGLEVAAELIRTYELQYVPGLLQIPAYTEAVARLAPVAGRSDAEVEQFTTLRQARQQLLGRERPLRLWAIVEESALRRPVGGPAVQRAQLDALLGAVEQGTVSLQIVPIHSPGHAATGGAFSLLRFPEPDLPDVVYLEHLTGALYLDRREEIEAYAEIFDALAASIPPPQATPGRLRELREEFDA